MTEKKIDVKAAMAAASTIKATAEALNVRRGELVQERQRLLSANEALYRQPVRRDDVKALVLFAIDRWSDEFLSNWTPVLRDFAAPIGPRPKTLEAQQDAYDKANKTAVRARENVERLERQLASQQREAQAALATADAGGEYRKPRTVPVDLAEVETAKRVLRDAELALKNVERPGAVNLQSGSFERSSAPMMVQDAAVILEGGYTGMLASMDGAPVIDHYRNIVSGALLPDVPQLNRANQSIAVKSACFFMGDLIKAKVEKHFDSVIPADLEAEAALLPLDECRATIAANESRAQALQTEIEEIDAQLRSIKL